MSVSGSSQPLASVVSTQDLMREVSAYSRVTVEDLLREIAEIFRNYQVLEPDHPQRLVILAKVPTMMRSLLWKRALSNLPIDGTHEDLHAVLVYSDDGHRTVDATEVRGSARLSSVAEMITARLGEIRKASPQIFTDLLTPEVLRGWIQEANDLVWREYRLGPR